MNKDMIKELEGRKPPRFPHARILIFLAFAIFVFYAFGGWTKYAPPVRNWLLALSVDASIWLQSLSECF